MGTFRLTERERVMKEIKLSLDLKDGVFTINDGTIEALGRPRQVQLLINMQEKMLVLRACSVNDTQAVVLPKEHVMSTDISGRSIMKELRSKMNWNDDAPREFKGKCYPTIRAVTFDLNDVTILS